MSALTNFFNEHIKNKLISQWLEGMKEKYPNFKIEVKDQDWFEKQSTEVQTYIIACCVKVMSEFQVENPEWTHFREVLEGMPYASITDYILTQGRMIYVPKTLSERICRCLLWDPETELPKISQELKKMGL